MRPIFRIAIIAGSAAANAESATFRANSVRDADHFAEYELHKLKSEPLLLAEAIVAAVRALAGSTTPQHRQHIAQALTALGAAAKVIQPRAPRNLRTFATSQAQPWWSDI